MLRTTEVIKVQKIAMTGTKFSFNGKLQEMYVGMGCSLAAANRCTFDGKIFLKKDRIRDVANQIKITRKYEAVRNVSRNAVKYMRYKLYHIIIMVYQDIRPIYQIFMYMGLKGTKGTSKFFEVCFF